MSGVTKDLVKLHPTVLLTSETAALILTLSSFGSGLSLFTKIPRFSGVVPKAAKLFGHGLGCFLLLSVFSISHGTDSKPKLEELWN